MQVQLDGGAVLVQDCKLARGPTHAVRVQTGEGMFYARNNVIERHTGDAYHFEAGSHGVVTLIGSIIRKIAGQPLFVTEGADVELLD